MQSKINAEVADTTPIAATSASPAAAASVPDTSSADNAAELEALKSKLKTLIDGEKAKLASQIAEVEAKGLQISPDDVKKILQA